MSAEIFALISTIMCIIFKTVVVEKFKVCGGLMVECSWSKGVESVFKT